MKKFKFSLERVLDYRKQLESARRRALATAVVVLRRRERELAALREEMNTYRTRMAALGTGRVSARDLSLYRSYLTHLELKVDESTQWMSDARSAVEKRRADLVKATKDTKVLSKVKEHQRAKHQYAADVEETKTLDEVGSTRFLVRQAAAAEEGLS